MVLRNLIICLYSSVGILLISASLSAGENKTLQRVDDPVVLECNVFESMHGSSLEKLSLMAFRSGKWEPIPFGLYVMFLYYKYPVMTFLQTPANESNEPVLGILKRLLPFSKLQIRRGLIVIDLFLGDKVFDHTLDTLLDNKLHDNLRALIMSKYHILPNTCQPLKNPLGLMREWGCSET